MRCYRYSILWIAAGAVLGAMALAQSQSLVVERHGDTLHVTAPQVHFIEGKALRKLKDGSAVAYIMTLSAMTEHARNPVFRLRERFVISFDLWEEKYSAVQTGQERRAASRMTAAMTEAWCLENMPIPVRAVPDRQSFVIRLECQVDEGEGEREGNGGSGLTLVALIDIFSRKESDKPLRWEASAGPMRLSDLKNNRQAR